MAKACSHGDAMMECVHQDLLPGDGGSLEAGDSVEIKYTAHLFENHSIGEVHYRMPAKRTQYLACIY